MAAEPIEELEIEDLPILSPGPPSLYAVQNPDTLPPADEPLMVIGRAAQTSWNYLWNWTKNTARDAVSWADITSDPAGQKIIAFVENYVGASQKAVGSVVNDLADYTHRSLHNVGVAAQWTYSHVHWLEGLMNDVVGGLAAELNDLIHLNLPGLIDDVANQINALRADTFNALAAVPNWAIDNIFDPLHDEIGRVNENIRLDTHNAMDALRGDLADLANGLQNDMARLLGNLETVVGPLAVAVGALEQFKDECAEPMCQTMGPKTDLGKLLKGLEAAGILALLLEIGNLDEAGVEAKLREMAGDMSRIVSTFDSVFVGGGGTLLDFGKALL